MNTTEPQPGDRIDEEEVCKNCFVDYLTRVCGSTDVTVTREKDDPPDYWATISGRLFALEVTSIVNDQERMAGYKGLAQKLQAHARLSGLLKGFYTLCFFLEPNVPRHGSRDWHNLIAAAMLYLRQTATLTQADEEVLVNDGEGKISLGKVAANPDRVIFGAWVPTPKLEVEAETELSLLLQRAVTTKMERLEKKRISGKDAILLLYDAYNFGTVLDVKVAFRAVRNADWFHSVFWVYPVWRSPETQTELLLPLSRCREGCFLHTRETTWLRDEGTDAYRHAPHILRDDHPDVLQDGGAQPEN